jgi:hypothetical protein
MEIYKAKENHTFVRKIDGFDMGNELYLGDFIDGTKDTIDNYEQVYVVGNSSTDFMIMENPTMDDRW